MAAKKRLIDVDRRIVAHLRRMTDRSNEKEFRFPSVYMIAKQAEIHPSTFSKIFSGERGVGFATFIRLLEKLPVSADLLLAKVTDEEMESALAGLRPDWNHAEKEQPGVTPAQQATAKVGAVKTIVGRKTARINKPTTKKRRNPAPES